MRVSGFAISTFLVLGGCAGPAWYQNRSTDTARLRVVSELDGNTAFVTSSSASCDLDPTRRNLGWFHPNSDSWQAYRRGFDHKLGMPEAQGLPAVMYAEYVIDANAPFFVWTNNISSAGGVVVSPAASFANLVQTTIAAGFTPAAGRDYELRFSPGNEGAHLVLFELRDGRREAKILDAGMRACK